mmetsp:Transcript_1938/g.4648  ORF Transcript_1938/g.4648 Transcript_1938/m.4648 type:complete len:132 (+) Transcript_1938:433-828(+)
MVYTRPKQPFNAILLWGPSPAAAAKSPCFVFKERPIANAHSATPRHFYFTTGTKVAVLVWVSLWTISSNCSGPQPQPQQHHPQQPQQPSAAARTAGGMEPEFNTLRSQDLQDILDEPLGEEWEEVQQLAQC